MRKVVKSKSRSYVRRSQEWGNVRLVIESLESRRLLAADFTAIGTLLDAKLASINASLGTIDTAKLPVVNQSLSQISQTKSFIQSFESKLVAAVKGIGSAQASAIQSAITATLGPAGLGVLADANKDGVVNANDVAVVHPTGSAVQPDDLGITFSLVGAAPLNIGKTALGSGLASVPLAINSSTALVDRTLRFSFDKLTFGWTNGHAYFGSTAPIIISNVGTLHVNLSAQLLPGMINGVMGFMPFTAQIGAGDPTKLEADFTLPVNSAGKITGATLSGASSLQLQMVSSIGSGALSLPQLSDTYLQTWNFNGGDANAVMLGAAADGASPKRHGRLQQFDFQPHHAHRRQAGQDPQADRAGRGRSDQAVAGPH